MRPVLLTLGIVGSLFSLDGCDSPTQPVQDPSVIASSQSTTSGTRSVINVPGLGKVVLKDLGTLPGDNSAFATAVNRSGQVVGWSIGLVGHAWAYTDAEGMVPLLPLPGDVGAVAEKNNRWGRIVGASTNSQSGERAAVWPTANTPSHPLSAPSGEYQSHAYGVNALGDVVGQLNGRPALWPHTGGYRYLKGLPGQDGLGAATAINDAAIIVGTTTAHPYGPDGKELSAAVVWYQDGHVEDVSEGFVSGTAIDNNGQYVGAAVGGPPLPEPIFDRGILGFLGKGLATTIAVASTTDGEENGFAAAALDHMGRIVGTLFTGSVSAGLNEEPSVAVLRGAQGTIYKLGGLPGGCCSGASGINNFGRVVGSASVGDFSSPSHAVIWTMPFSD